LIAHVYAALLAAFKAYGQVMGTGEILAEFRN
jgi:hypothetical protein